MVLTGSAISSQDTDRPGVGPDGDEGVLDSTAADRLTDDDEQVRAACESPMGLARIDGDDERRVSDAVTVVFTDRRLVFCLDPTSEGEGSDDVGSIEYADVAAVSRDAEAGGRVEIATVDGVTWRLPLGVAETVAADAASRDLDWLGTVRSRVRSVTNDVELAVGEIEERAAEMDWEAATDTYDEIRAEVDRAHHLLLQTEPISTGTLAPDLPETERGLERTAAELFLERARSQSTLGEQLVDGTHYEQARPVLERARDHLARARSHAAAGDRQGGFQFGEDRELEERLEAVEWEIEAVASEPLRHGHEARIAAAEADDPETTADRYEQAIRAFQHVLTLAVEDGDEDFPGDREAVEQHVADAARDLVPVHRELARERWNAGVASHEEGDVKTALRLFTTAQEHLARAHELAEEVAPERAEEMAARLEGILESLTTVRQTATVGDDSTESAAEAGDAGDDEAEDPAARFSAAELQRIDTATEIHLGNGTDLIGVAGPDQVELDDPTNGTEPAGAAEGDQESGTEGKRGSETEPAEAEVGDVSVGAEGPTED